MLCSSRSYVVLTIGVWSFFFEENRTVERTMPDFVLYLPTHDAPRYVTFFVNKIFYSDMGMIGKQRFWFPGFQKDHYG